MIAKEKFIELYVHQYPTRSKSPADLFELIKVASDAYDKMLLTEGVGINFSKTISTLLNVSSNCQYKLDHTVKPELWYQKETLELRKNYWDAIDLLAKITCANTGEPHTKFGHGKRPE